MTERSDIHKSSTFNLQSSIPACPDVGDDVKTTRKICQIFFRFEKNFFYLPFKSKIFFAFL